MYHLPFIDPVPVRRSSKGQPKFISSHPAQPIFTLETLSPQSAEVSGNGEISAGSSTSQPNFGGKQFSTKDAVSNFQQNWQPSTPSVNIYEYCTSKNTDEEVHFVPNSNHKGSQASFSSGAAKTPSGSPV